MTNFAGSDRAAGGHEEAAEVARSPGRSTLTERFATPARSVAAASTPSVVERSPEPSSAVADRQRVDHDLAAAIGFLGGPAESIDASVARLGAGTREKAVGDGSGGNLIGGLVVEGGPEGGGNQGGNQPQPVNNPPPKKKKAGVESFTVDWKVGAANGPTNAKLRLDYNAKFKKDDDHDPALAEFRQNAMTVLTVSDGPHKGTKIDTSPLHDDNYSRADDLNGNKITDQLFYSNDNPGASPLDKDDIIDYAFTAEQMIIDTSDGNKVIAKRGPHTATIKGKDPRATAGVPTKLS